MTTNDIRLFIEVTTRQAEEAFRRQMEESNRRIEVHMAATRLRERETPRPEVFTQPRGLWWSEPRVRGASAGGALLAKEASR